jgi:hypothetical protein
MGVGRRDAHVHLGLDFRGVPAAIVQHAPSAQPNLEAPRPLCPRVRISPNFRMTLLIQVNCRLLPNVFFIFYFNEAYTQVVFAALLLE